LSEVSRAIRRSIFQMCAIASTASRSDPAGRSI
jgi:hypothetical protein